ncbi:transposase [Salmonella enterica]|uniref:IS66-like element accessory protein TnpA n=1 Tax=Klebsiella pneumoniae TaxID=573 RepID=UPI0010137AEB|nr:MULTISPECIES: transposase [Enterobacteriaceae]EDM3692525.1 IS66 family insertion sequence element accessory protein TnpB [Salmonella enterica subsp. enterica serovar Infantis]EDP9826233.1 transposase [Salmonella enterica subsp. enterica]EAN8329452.1 transposase [Salmonella enterica]EBD7602061.1 transposase [Salmonella enterica]EEJ8591579.1 transposase [Salmonella enterica subsp. enterica]
METQSWRKEPRKNYSNDFKLRMVELASRPGACVAQIARENGINDNVIFKWLRLWQDEGRISRRLPATVESSSSPMMLPVEVMPDPAPTGEANTDPGQFSALSTSSCCVEFRHGKMTLENPSPELLVVLLRELTGRSQ